MIKALALNNMQARGIATMMQNYMSIQNLFHSSQGSLFRLSPLNYNKRKLIAKIGLFTTIKEFKQLKSIDTQIIYLGSITPAEAKKHSALIY